MDVIIPSVPVHGAAAGSPGDYPVCLLDEFRRDNFGNYILD